MINFIVASCKSWNYPAFQKLLAKNNYQGSYVSNPIELSSALTENKNLRYIFFLHWNWRVVPEVYNTYECICFHMTDLPYGRGGSPLQNLIMDNKTETVVTAFRMVEEMDSGPIYVKRAMSLAGRAEDIYIRAADLCCDMIEFIVNTDPAPQNQSGKPVLFKRRTPGQSILPKCGSLESIYNFIRMLDAPTYPLAFIDYGDFRLEFDRAEVRENCVRAQVTIRLGNEVN